MEIVNLRLVITEDDLNGLLRKFIKTPPKIGDLTVRVVHNGLLITGTYDTIFPIPFQSEWRLFVENGKIAAELSGIKVVGVRVGFLKGYMLKALSSNSTELELDEESLLFDVDRCLNGLPVPIKTNLASVGCDGGCLVIECERKS